MTGQGLCHQCRTDSDLKQTRLFLVHVDIMASHHEQCSHLATCVNGCTAAPWLWLRKIGENNGNMLM